MAETNTEQDIICIEPLDNLLGLDEFFGNFKESCTKIFTNADYELIKDSMNLEIYPKLTEYSRNNGKKLMVTFSSDANVSSCTISGNVEKYSVGSSGSHTSQLKVIYISPYLDLKQCKYDTECTNYHESIMSCVTGDVTYSFPHNRINIEGKNITYLGTQFSTDEEDVVKMSLDCRVYTLETIRKKNIDKLLKSVQNSCSDNPVHIVFNLASLSHIMCPAVYRNMDMYDAQNMDVNDIDGFNHLEFASLVRMIKNIHSKGNLVGLDIVGYHFGTKNNSENNFGPNMLTVNVIDTITSAVESKNNDNNDNHTVNRTVIVNEHTKFLIWRPLDRKSERDYGWFILRGVSNNDAYELIQMFDDEKEEDTYHIKMINFDNDTECNNTGCNDECNDECNDTYTIGDNVSMVTVTTLEEQTNKSYYLTDRMEDACLFPFEFKNIISELIDAKGTVPEEFEMTNEEFLELVQIQKKIEMENEYMMYTMNDTTST
jgi:arginase family enzyme